MSKLLSTADLHVHSTHSDGVARIPEIMDYVQSQTDLSVIAITDHNTIEGALFARELAEMYDFEVVVGEEVSTKSGHVIGLFIEEEIRRGMTVKDTIRAIHEQGGVVVIPHPFSAQGIFGPFGFNALQQAFNDFAFHALEVYNSLPFLAWANSMAAKAFTGGQGFAAVGGSDAHFLGAIGKGSTVFHGSTAADLRASIENLDTRALAGTQGLSVVVNLARAYPRIRRQQAWNSERCKTH